MFFCAPFISGVDNQVADFEPALQIRRDLTRLMAVDWIVLLTLCSQRDTVGADDSTSILDALVCRAFHPSEPFARILTLVCLFCRIWGSYFVFINFQYF